VTEAYIDQYMTDIAAAVGADVDVWRSGHDYELRCRTRGHVCTAPPVRFSGTSLDDAVEKLRVALLEWAKHMPDVWLRNDPRKGPTLADLKDQLDRLTVMVDALTAPAVATV
jgi:hypothetical protein